MVLEVVVSKAPQARLRRSPSWPGIKAYFQRFEMFSINRVAARCFCDSFAPLRTLEGPRIGPSKWKRLPTSCGW